jgi:hypothetical protein
MIHGQCLCGAVTFEIDAPDGTLGETRFCYCTECRRANGTAFSANVPVPQDQFRLTSGVDGITEYESSPGNHRAFCATCGSPVYGKKADAPDQIRVRLGSLDQTADATVSAHVWVSEQPKWYRIEGYLKRFKQTAEGPGGTPK